MGTSPDSGDKSVRPVGVERPPTAAPATFDPKCFTEAARLTGTCSPSEKMNLFPTAAINSGRFEFFGTLFKDKAEAPRVEAGEKPKPGVEKVTRADGKTEYNVTAGADAKQNAAWAQEAVRSAEKTGGGTVNLGEGTYRGQVAVRGDNITVKSKDGKAVFDMGNQPGNGTDSVFSVSGKNVTLDGMTIQNWKPQSDKQPVVGVDVKGGSEHVRLQNLTIQGLGTEGAGGNKAGWGSHGIRVQSEGKGINDVVVDNCRLKDLKLGQHEAISFMADGGSIKGAKVTNCDIRGIDNIGVVFEGSHKGTVSDFEVRGNRISDSSSINNLTYRNRSSAGVQVDSNVNGGKITGNVIQNSDHAVILESEKGGVVRGIDISGNQFRNNKVAHVLADASDRSGATVDGASIHNNQYTPTAPILSKDHPSKVRNVTEQGNKPIMASAPELPVGPKERVAVPADKKTEPLTPPEKRTEPLTPPAKNVDADSAVLTNPSASMADKAAATMRLYDALPKDDKGRAHIKLKDGDKEREFEISKETPKPGVNVNAIFTKDEQGKDHPVLRWVDRGGKLEQQKDGTGAQVDFRSNYAREKMQNSAIAKLAGSSEVTPPDRKPEERRKPEDRRKPDDRLPPVLPPVLPPTDGSGAPRVVAQVNSWTTLYTPRAGEGGVYGNQPPRGEGSPVFLPDHTVQKFLQNPVAAGYAAAAGDPRTINGKWGTMFRLPEMNNDQFFKSQTGMTRDQWVQKWGPAFKQQYGFDLTGVHFRVVDTGGAIKGTGRVDLCVDRGTAHTPIMERYNSPDVKHSFRMEVLDSRIRRKVR
jgi:hypothetical protein